MPKLMILCIHADQSWVNNIANFALLRCKICGLEIRQCKKIDKYHVCASSHVMLCHDMSYLLFLSYLSYLTYLSYLEASGVHWVIMWLNGLDEQNMEVCQWMIWIALTLL